MLRYYRRHTVRDGVESMIRSLRNALNHVIVQQGYGRNVLMMVTVQSNRLYHVYNTVKRPLWQWKDPATWADFMSSIVAALMSADLLGQPDELSISVTFGVSMPRGRGRLDMDAPMVKALNKKTRVCVRIQADDDALCCARALVTMKVFADEQRGDFTGTLPFHCVAQGLEQRERAEALHATSGVPEGVPCGVAELRLFQTAMPDYQIKVWDAEKAYQVIFDGESQVGHCTRNVFLVLACGHYWGVKSVPGLMNMSYYCHDCDRGYKDTKFRSHTCKGNRCPRCLQKDCIDHARKRETGQSEALRCEGCKRCFYAAACLALHRRRAVDGSDNESYSVCLVLKACDRCGKEQDR